MMGVDDLRAHIAAHVPDVGVSVEGAVLVVAGKDVARVAAFLRDDGKTKLDFLANLCASDFLAKGDKPGYLEVIYHLYSVALRHGPVVLKARTADRGAGTHLPSVTPVWRGAELQEREAFDLYGVVFDGHPDLRRILTWDEMEDFPMRKDYQPPEDNEWEPTPHGALVEKLKARGDAQ